MRLIAAPQSWLPSACPADLFADSGSRQPACPPLASSRCVPDVTGLALETGGPATLDRLVGTSYVGPSMNYKAHALRIAALLVVTSAVKWHPGTRRG